MGKIASGTVSKQGFSVNWSVERAGWHEVDLPGELADPEEAAFFAEMCAEEGAGAMAAMDAELPMGAEEN